MVQSVFPERKFAAENGFAPHEQKPFLPWQLNVDGTGAEERSTISAARNSSSFGRRAPIPIEPDPDTGELPPKLGLQDNNSAGIGGNNVDAFRFLREDPRTPGRYLAVLSPEFGTCSGGAVVTIDSAPDVLPKDVKIEYVTSPNTYGQDSKTLFRSPMAGSNGELWASVSTLAQSRGLQIGRVRLPACSSPQAGRLLRACGQRDARRRPAAHDRRQDKNPMGVGRSRGPRPHQAGPRQWSRRSKQGR